MSQDRVILSLDAARKFCPDNTIRAHFYVLEMEKLCENECRLLRVLEAKLFARYSKKTNPCSVEGRFLSQNIFYGEEGHIVFSFSCAKHKFVLVEFSLNFEGGGDGAYNGCADPIGARLREWLVVARDFLAPSVALSRKAIAAFTRKVAFSCIDFHDRRKTYDAAFGGIEDFTYAFAASYTIYATKIREPARPVPLPTWCLIKDVIFTPEQLQSKLARSMLAGEILCKSVADRYALDGKQTRGGRIGHLLRNDRAHFWADEELLSECEMIILSIAATPSNGPLKSRYFSTARLIDRDCLADDCRMTLIANELVYLISYALARKIFFLEEEKHMNICDMRSILQKFALISEFALLSRCFFGGADFSLHEEISISREIRDRCRSGDRGVKKYFCELERFGMLITHILQQISDDTVDDRPYRCANPHRLLELSSAILAPL